MREAPLVRRQFAAHLESLLNRAGLTPEELAQKTGRSTEVVLQYLRARTIPRLEDLPMMAAALRLRDSRGMIPKEW